MCVASSPKVNTYMSDRIMVAEYHAIYTNFCKLLKNFFFLYPTLQWVRPVSGYSPAMLGYVGVGLGLGWD